MNIQNISKINLNTYQPSFQKRRTKHAEHIKMQTGSYRTATLPYTTRRNIQDENEYFENFKTRSGKVTLKEYKEIASKHPRTLSKSYALCRSQEDIRTRPETMAKFAVCLKDYYDTKYEKYTIVSIGTSPSPITEVMDNLGCDVIYLPITHLRFIEQNPLSPFRNLYPTNESRHPNIKKLMKYASKKGIADPKKGELVVIDYSATGKTLATMGNILKERGDIIEEKIHLHAFNNDLEKICKDTSAYEKYGLDVVDVIDLKEDLYCSEFNKITNVPHFVFNDPQAYQDKKTWQIFRDFETYSQPEARAWALCTTHEAMKLLEKMGRETT
ncbi:MAG: hypothetical protein IJW73_06960 [Candidatus Gastranaerophilales bacterium]|nr:hypothetical protein [Candidatus Gastranaerophilales bacterium]